MRLSHIVPSLAEQHGGPSKSVRALCAALARHGEEVELLTTDPDGSTAGDLRMDGALRIRTFRRDWPQRLCVSAGLRRALGDTNAQVLHHHSLWLRTLHYAHRHTCETDTPLVVSPRGMMSAWAWQHRGSRKRLARAFVHPGALQAVDGWHATSAAEEQEIRSLGYTQPVCIAPNGVDAPTSAEREHALAHWREACPAAAGRRVALFYSRFHEKKRVLELIDVWLEFAPRDWLLLLVGLPQDYTPAELERYANERNGAARVLAFTGAGRPPPYCIASLFLLPSHNENFGLVVAEAMAHGVPVLVTDSTPWSSVYAAQLGWCVPWAEYGATLAAATAESDEQLARRGAAARSWVLPEFAWDASARRLAAFYTMLSEHKR